MKPTILFVSPVPNLKGGAERVLLDMLDNPAIRPALAVPDGGELWDLAQTRGMPAYRFDLGPVERVRRPISVNALAGAAKGAVIAARQIAEAAKQVGAEAVHTNGLKVHVVGALARRLHGTRIIAHMHDIAYSRLDRIVWRGIAAGVSRMIVVSPPCWPGGSTKRVGVVLNGSNYQAVAAPRALTGPPVIGFVGRFHPFKGLHHLLDWFERVPPGLTGPLVVRGRATDDGIDYWRSLQPRIEALGSRCRYEGWQEPGTDPYAGIDILAVPSVMPDPGPLVIMEAMLAAIPVIAYNAGGAPLILGDTGRLVTDADTFSAAVHALADPATYAQQSRASLERARERFGLDAFWSRLNAQYRLTGVGVGDA